MDVITLLWCGRDAVLCILWFLLLPFLTASGISLFGGVFLIYDGQ